MAFDLRKLLCDVFNPQQGERVAVACDLPRDPADDTAAWRDRRAMAAEWRECFEQLGAERGFETLPLLSFDATYANNAELPEKGTMGGRQVAISEVLSGATLATFLTQYSATAPLDFYCQQKEDFRAASLPGVEKRMEQTALAADYQEVARRCKILYDVMQGAEGLQVSFSTGHRCYFDLRFRKPEMDDGFLPRFKQGDRLINLPSGETFIVPYEGERALEASKTEGVLPISLKGETVLLVVSRNRIRSVEGVGPQAAAMREIFAADPARENIAEVAFGCNEWAKVTGIVLEDEKAGFHWAFGRSDHLGGTVGVSAFKKRENVIHQDVVYALESPIQVNDARLIKPNGEQIRVIGGGAYLLF